MTGTKLKSAESYDIAMKSVLSSMQKNENYDEKLMTKSDYYTILEILKTKEYAKGYNVTKTMGGPRATFHNVTITPEGYRFLEGKTDKPPVIHQNIQVSNAYGSVIGNNNVATINYNESISDLRKQVISSNSSDKPELEKIVNLLEMVVNNQVPVNKGLFSSFSEVMERNSWITSPIASIIFSYLIAQ